MPRSTTSNALESVSIKFTKFERTLEKQRVTVVHYWTQSKFIVYVKSKNRLLYKKWSKDVIWKALLLVKIDCWLKICRFTDRLLIIWWRQYATVSIFGPDHLYPLVVEKQNPLIPYSWNSLYKIVSAICEYCIQFCLIIHL